MDSRDLKFIQHVIRTTKPRQEGCIEFAFATTLNNEALMLLADKRYFKSWLFRDGMLWYERSHKNG